MDSIQLMNLFLENQIGMDIVIVSTNDVLQEEVWEERLDSARGQIVKKDALIICVSEDWKTGNAGNGLGTLYAFEKARNKALLKHQVDIMQKLQMGASIAMYHSAGKGTRLAPLPASEFNNKPGIKLPSCVQIKGQSLPITILEAVIRQTSIYAPRNSGRLSVFWGDQVFIPTLIPKEPEFEIDIFAKLEKMVDKEAWVKRDLHKYGLVAVDDTGSARQVEKVDFETISQLIRNGNVSTNGGFGISLGSFSLSPIFLLALLDEFRSELQDQQLSLDTDPHFWMPLTLNFETYRTIFQIKDPNVDLGWLEHHHQRMQEFARRFFEEYPSRRLFGVVDVGEATFWWDYGQLKTYYLNNLKLTNQSSEESMIMRSFFHIRSSKDSTTAFSASTIDSGGLLRIEDDGPHRSLLINCDIKGGKIKNSVLIGVKADWIQISNSIVINSQIGTLSDGDNLVLYNVYEPGTLELPENANVRADVFTPPLPSPIKLHSHTDRQGNQDWNVRLGFNSHTFSEIYLLNKTFNPKTIVQKMLFL